MSSKIVSPLETADLKIALGRILTLLGDLSKQVGFLTDFLEYTFRGEAYTYEDNLHREVSGDDIHDSFDEQDYGDGSDEE